jgi:hypothetical protein
MEFALNLAWLCIAIIFVSLFVFYRRNARGKGGSVAPWRMWVAIGCGLILLFFVISCTDDLNEQILTIEDSSFSWRHCAACRKAPAVDSTSRAAHSLAAIAAASFSWSDEQIGIVEPARRHVRLNSPSFRITVDRGPPSLSPTIN